MATIVHRKDKYYVVYYTEDKKGNRKQKWETYKSKEAAEHRRFEVEGLTEKGVFVPPVCKTVRELMKEYINTYGKEAWTFSSYESHVSIINNYILPTIGDMKLEEITVFVLEHYYRELLKVKAVKNPMTGRRRNEYVTPSTVHRIHQILRSCFNQAVKWGLMEKNPARQATLPRVRPKKRDIWDTDTLFKAINLCQSDILKLALNLSFACSLRMGEMLGLTWDCVDISEDAEAKSEEFVYINKELQRVSLKALADLEDRDVILQFPNAKPKCKTVLILKTPKTESSVRKIYIPKTVAGMLRDWKARQEEAKGILGSDYQDYNLVFASDYGTPVESNKIREQLNRLIKDNDLPPVVFHSMRHASITYKLKLSGGDIKSVQGDSGHAQAKMVEDVYSHILDEDRKTNAERFEQQFYSGKGRSAKKKEKTQIPAGIDPAILKALQDPETAKMLAALVKSIENKDS
ncbi:MAG: site-specific integrase [Eubacterium sp.]|nr:site-specific integrase [Eubacterium sp.]